MNSVPWLAERIREIERQVNQMPSIAVFVGDEAEVEPLASSLNTALANDNIQAIPCLKGQTVGQDNDIRVFDIQHIKGLEFEAVFFIGVDRLARLHPGLYDKYLYVGTSRAATYLGITCDSSLPEPLAPLRRMLIPDWSSSKFEDSDGRRNPKSEGPPS
jgi:superfamily I DNA and RNA helicase